MAEITLKLEHTDVEKILNWITTVPLPYREVAPLIQKIAQQLQPAAPPPPADGAAQPEKPAVN